MCVPFFSIFRYKIYKFDMSGERAIIKRSQKKLAGMVALSGGMIVYYFVGPYDETRSMYKEQPVFTIILGVIFFTLFFYFLNELIKRKPEIILTAGGIELRDKGFFEWGMIESFSTLLYKNADNRTEDLVLHFRDFPDLKFQISDLEKNRDELTDLILKYKGTADVYFAGHNSK
ncbi:hypothetical protein ACTHGU_07465 [Chitinophagaceae bacterium MMS25-I14]